MSRKLDRTFDSLASRHARAGSRRGGPPPDDPRL